MEMDPNPPSFNLQYNVPPMEIGKGYAAGITAAGESLSKGVSSVVDVMNRNRTADDTLTAMNQSGILSDKAFQAVSGKAVGAKEQMLGLYAGQWIAQQAQNRELQKMGYQGNIEQQVSHAKLLDQLSANRVGGQGGQGTQPVQQPVYQGRFGLNPTPLTGTTQAPTPLAAGPDITHPLAAQGTMTQPGYRTGVPGTPAQMTKIGPPIGAREPIPPGATVRQIKGPKGDLIQGVLQLDGTFRPRTGS